jgi:hypothetical protein
MQGEEEENEERGTRNFSIKMEDYSRITLELRILENGSLPSSRILRHNMLKS